MSLEEVKNRMFGQLLVGCRDKDGQQAVGCKVLKFCHLQNGQNKIFHVW